MKSEELQKLYLPLESQATVSYQRQMWEARFSPCGKYLVGCGYDATIQRWDISGEEPKQLSPLSGHNGWLQGLGFQPAGDRLLTADSWGRLTCWSYAAADSKPLWDLPEAHDGWIRALAVSPDGKWVATGGNDSVVRIHSVEDGKLHAELDHPTRIYSLAFHPDGKSLVSGDLEGKIRHWDPETKQVVRELDAGVLYLQNKIQQCGGVRRLSFDAKGEYLVCTGQHTPQGGFATGTPCALLFNWEKGELVREMLLGNKQDGFSYDAQFHPAGFLVLVACGMPNKGQLHLWGLEDDKPFHVEKKLTNGRAICLHPDGRRLAMLSAQSGNRNGRPDGEYEGGTAEIHLLTFPEPQAAE